MKPIELLSAAPKDETFDMDLRDRINKVIVAVNELMATGRIDSSPLADAIEQARRIHGSAEVTEDRDSTGPHVKIETPTTVEFWTNGALIAYLRKAAVCEPGENVTSPSGFPPSAWAQTEQLPRVK